MNIKQHSTPVNSEMHQTRDAIRRSWSHEERDKRRRIAAARQQFLFGVLLKPQATATARVA